MNPLPNPNFLITAHSTLSNALWASNDSSTLSPMLSTRDWILRKSLCRFIAVDFWCINPDWSVCIIVEITLFIRIANTLARIFTSFCRREIGWYYPRSRGSSLSGFNYKTIFALVIDWGRLPVSLAALNIFSKCRSMVPSYCFYTSMGSPSSLGALELGNKLITICKSGGHQAFP